MSESLESAGFCHALANYIHFITTSWLFGLIICLKPTLPGSLCYCHYYRSLMKSLAQKYLMDSPHCSLPTDPEKSKFFERYSKAIPNPALTLLSSFSITLFLSPGHTRRCLRNRANWPWGLETQPVSDSEVGENYVGSLSFLSCKWE